MNKPIYLKYAYFITLSPVILMPFYAFCQTPEPGSFFKRDYVYGTLDGKSVIKEKVNSKRQEHNYNNAETLERKSKTSIDFFEPEVADDPLAEFDNSPANLVPISMVSYVTNGNTEAEALVELKLFHDFITEYDLAPNEISVLGVPDFGTQDSSFDWAKIIIRGGTISLSGLAAKEYHLEKVPAWVVHTEIGDFLLEGYSDISKFVTSDGKLRRAMVMREPQVDLTKQQEDNLKE